MYSLQRVLLMQNSKCSKSNELLCNNSHFCRKTLHHMQVLTGKDQKLFYNLLVYNHTYMEHVSQVRNTRSRILGQIKQEAFHKTPLIPTRVRYLLGCQYTSKQFKGRCHVLKKRIFFYIKCKIIQIPQCVIELNFSKQKSDTLTKCFSKIKK